MKRQGCIYLITNLINEKFYIGSSIDDAKKRWREHRWYAKNGSTTHLHRAIRLHGEKNFKIEELCSVLVEKDLEQIELDYINKYECFSPKGYNMIDPNRYELAREMNKEFMLKQWADPKIREERLKPKYDMAAAQAIPIVAVSIYDGSVKFYDRVHDARRDGFAVSSIYACLNNEAKTGQKNCWFYKTEKSSEFYKQKALDLVGEFKTDFLKEIIGTHIETGRQEYFTNCQDLADKGFLVKAVRRVLRGGRESFNGYYWKYK